MQRVSHISARWVRRFGGAAIALVVILVMIGVVGYFVAPGIVKSAAEKQIAEETGRKAEIGSIRINPYLLAATVTDFKLYEADGSTVAARVDELYADISWASLFKRAAVFDELRVVKPVVHIARLAPQRFSFSDIVEKILAKPKNDAPLHFSVNNIRVEGGAIDFDDRVTGRKHRIEDIRVALPFVSDLPHDTDIFVTPAFAARVNGSPFALTGKARPFASAADATLDLDIADLDLPAYVDFSPIAFNFRIAAGKLGGKLVLTFRRAGQDADGKNQAQAIGLAGQINVDRLRVTDRKDKDALTLKQLSVGIRNIDLLRPSVALDSVVANGVNVATTRGKDGALDLVELFALPKSAPTVPKDVGAATAKPIPQRPLAVSVTTLRVTDGSVRLTDVSLVKPVVTTLRNIAVDAQGFSTTGAAPAKINASLQTEDGATFQHRGTFALSKKAASGDVTIKQLRPAQFSAYLAPYLNARIEDGSIDAASHYALDFSGEHPQLKLDAFAIKVEKLRSRLPDEKTTLIGAEKISLEGGSFDLASRALIVDALRLVAPVAAIQRSAQGQINLAVALAPAKARASPRADTGPAPTVTIKSLQIERGSVSFDDASTATPVRLRADDLNLSAQNLANAKGATIPFDLTATFDRKGRLAAKGSIVIDPLAVSASIIATKLPVAPLAAYAGERLNVSIANADLSVRGKLSVAKPVKGLGAGASESSGPWRVAFSGAADVTDFTALDKINAADFLRWKTLNVGKIDLQAPVKDAPLSLVLGDIAVSDFYARVIVNANGRLNVQDVIAAPGQTQSITTPDAQKGTSQPTPTPSATTLARAIEPKPTIRVGQGTLVNGTINFTDNFVKPNYTVNLTELGGSISAVASDDPKPADVNVRGRIDGDGSLAVNGKINPLAATLYTDIAAEAKDIELTHLSPYAVKYAGYSIERGKLSMTVKYHIENNKLDAQNRLFLDQLTFGERVESPTATKLPVLLAVALLKNSRGEIDVNLPVSGSLSDPQFSIGGVMVRVIINLLTRAVTAPFSLIGSAFGGGNAEELGYVEFAPGVSDLATEGKKRLETLAKALADRPALKLDIIGRFDPASDPEGIKRDHLLDQLKELKAKDLSKSGETVGRDDVTIAHDEYAKYLARVYDDTKLPGKPRNLIGIAKALPTEEMEKLLLADMKLDENDPRWLAEARADVVRHYIEDTDKIDRSRVFLVTPRLNADGIKDKGKPNRVDFALH